MAKIKKSKYLGKYRRFNLINISKHLGIKNPKNYSNLTLYGECIRLSKCAGKQGINAGIKGKIDFLVAWHKINDPADSHKTPSASNNKKPKNQSGLNKFKSFYKTWEWKTLRVVVLNKFGSRCQCCGATPEDLEISGEKVRIVVDHIKPIRKYWELRLVESNLQILCNECNMGKGYWDETDYRPTAENSAIDDGEYIHQNNFSANN